MKHEEKTMKMLLTFRDDEGDALLKLALLKERYDYRNYFTPELKAAVESAWLKFGDGEGPIDKETSDTLNDFIGNMMGRFGMRYTPHLLDLIDPFIDAKDLPAIVRRIILPDLFYTPGIREVVPTFSPEKGRGEAPGRTTFSDCAPYERLYKINLRKNPAILLREFKQVLVSVEINRKKHPEIYKAWEQDRSRKRKETWDHLKVWKMRRERKGFIEIAGALKIKISTAKMRFFRAYELIEDRPYDREKYKREHWNLKVCSTCPDNSDHGGTCTELCPDMLILVTKAVTRKKSSGNFEQIEAAHLANEWFTSEAREIQTKEDVQD